MEGKGLFFLIILAVVAIAAFGYLGVKTYKELKETPPQVPDKYGEAATTSRPHAPSTTPAAQDFMGAGRDAFTRGDYSEALANFRKASEVKPTDQTAREYAAAAEAMLRVQTAQLNKKWDEALAACLEGMKYSLSLPEARRRMAEITELKAYHENYEKGNAAVQKGDYAEAVQAFRAAGRIATRLGLTSDADQKAAELKTLAEKSATASSDVGYVLQMCAERGDPYATFAATSYYLSCDYCKPLHPDLKSKQEIARTTITSNRAKYPSPRSTEIRRIDIVQKKIGEVLKGQILEKDERFIKLRQERDGKTVTRTIPMKEVAEVKEEVITPETANTKQAEEILAQAVKEVELKHPFKALSLAGILMCEFGDLPLLKEEELQRKLITAASVGTALQGDITLAKLVETCVLRCQTICGKCEGIGKLLCHTCKGTGQIIVPCPACNGTGKFTCYTCGGQGKLPGPTPNTWTRCQTCNGKGTLPCQECQGTKQRAQNCDTCRGEKGLMCDTCLGSGQRLKR